MLFFSKTKYSDKEIVEGLQNDILLEDDILKYLYSTFYPVIKKYILSKGGNDIEAKDIFQDAIIVFYQNVKAGKYKLNAKISTYLIALARNMWINRKNQLSKIMTQETWSGNGKVTSSLAIDLLLETERNEFARELLNELGDDCRKILSLAIFQNQSMKTICEIMGYQNEQVARNKKSKCLKYLRKAIGKSSGLLNVLNELK